MSATVGRPQRSVDFSTSGTNEYQWRNLYLHKFGTCTYPPFNPTRSAAVRALGLKNPIRSYSPTGRGVAYAKGLRARKARNAAARTKKRGPAAERGADGASSSSPRKPREHKVFITEGPEADVNGAAAGGANDIELPEMGLSFSGAIITGTTLPEIPSSDPSSPLVDVSSSTKSLKKRRSSEKKKRRGSDHRRGVTFEGLAAAAVADQEVDMPVLESDGEDTASDEVDDDDSDDGTGTSDSGGDDIAGFLNSPPHRIDDPEDDALSRRGLAEREKQAKEDAIEELLDPFSQQNGGRPLLPTDTSLSFPGTPNGLPDARTWHELHGQRERYGEVVFDRFLNDGALMGIQFVAVLRAVAASYAHARFTEVPGTVATAFSRLITEHPKLLTAIGQAAMKDEELHRQWREDADRERVERQQQQGQRKQQLQSAQSNASYDPPASPSGATTTTYSQIPRYDSRSSMDDASGQEGRRRSVWGTLRKLVATNAFLVATAGHGGRRQAASGAPALQPSASVEAEESVERRPQRTVNFVPRGDGPERGRNSAGASTEDASFEQSRGDDASWAGDGTEDSSPVGRRFSASWGSGDDLPRRGSLFAVASMPHLRHNAKGGASKLFTGRPAAAGRPAAPPGDGTNRGERPEGIRPDVHLKRGLTRRALTSTHGGFVAAVDDVVLYLESRTDRALELLAFSLQQLLDGVALSEHDCETFFTMYPPPPAYLCYEALGTVNMTEQPPHAPQVSRAATKRPQQVHRATAGGGEDTATSSPGEGQGDLASTPSAGNLTANASFGTFGVADMPRSSAHLDHHASARQDTAEPPLLLRVDRDINELAEMSPSVPRLDEPHPLLLPLQVFESYADLHAVPAVSRLLGPLLESLGQRDVRLYAVDVVRLDHGNTGGGSGGGASPRKDSSSTTATGPGSPQRSQHASHRPSSTAASTPTTLSARPPSTLTGGGMTPRASRLKAVATAARFSRAGTSRSTMKMEELAAEQDARAKEADEAIISAARAALSQLSLLLVHADLATPAHDANAAPDEAGSWLPAGVQYLASVLSAIVADRVLAVIADADASVLGDAATTSADATRPKTFLERLGLHRSSAKSKGRAGGNFAPSSTATDRAAGRGPGAAAAPPAPARPLHVGSDGRTASARAFETSCGDPSMFPKLSFPMADVAERFAEVQNPLVQGLLQSRVQRFVLLERLICRYLADPATFGLLPDSLAVLPASHPSVKHAVRNCKALAHYLQRAVAGMAIEELFVVQIDETPPSWRAANAPEHVTGIPTSLHPLARTPVTPKRPHLLPDDSLESLDFRVSGAYLPSAIAAHIARIRRGRPGDAPRRWSSAFTILPPAAASARSLHSARSGSAFGGGLSYSAPSFGLSVTPPEALRTTMSAARLTNAMAPASPSFGESVRSIGMASPDGRRASSASGPGVGQSGPHESFADPSRVVLEQLQLPAFARTIVADYSGEHTALVSDRTAPPLIAFLLEHFALFAAAPVFAVDPVETQLGGDKGESRGAQQPGLAAARRLRKAAAAASGGNDATRNAFGRRVSVAAAGRGDTATSSTGMAWSSSELPLTSFTLPHFVIESAVRNLLQICGSFRREFLKGLDQSARRILPLKVATPKVTDAAAAVVAEAGGGSMMGIEEYRPDELLAIALRRHKSFGGSEASDDDTATTAATTPRNDGGAARPEGQAGDGTSPGSDHGSTGSHDEFEASIERRAKLQRKSIFDHTIIFGAPPEEPDTPGSDLGQKSLRRAQNSWFSGPARQGSANNTDQNAESLGASKAAGRLGQSFFGGFQSVGLSRSFVFAIHEAAGNKFKTAAAAVRGMQALHRDTARKHAEEQARAQRKLDAEFFSERVALMVQRAAGVLDECDRGRVKDFNHRAMDVLVAVGAVVPRAPPKRRRTRRNAGQAASSETVEE